MAAVKLKAHFDGSHIVLDEPYVLPRDSALVVTVLPVSTHDDIDDALWMCVAETSDAFEFLSDPAEDIYSLNDGEPFDNAV